MKNKTEVQQIEEKSLSLQGEAEMLIAKAIDKNVPVESLERLLAMRRELKAEQAKEAFDGSMAAFQSECPTIEKRKKVDFGTTHYSYAPLEDIVSQVKELLSKNGFSYTFDTKQTENAMKIFCKVKHLFGHSEVSEFEIAIDTSSKMNVSQRYGAASSYGKRYAFCNAFGILTGDEDTDAVSASVTPLTARQMADKKESVGLVTPPQLKFIRDLLTQKGYSEKQLCTKFNVTDISQLTFPQASESIAGLKSSPVSASKTEVLQESFYEHEEYVDVNEINL